MNSKFGYEIDGSNSCIRSMVWNIKQDVCAWTNFSLFAVIVGKKGKVEGRGRMCVCVLYVEYHIYSPVQSVIDFYGSNLYVTVMVRWVREGVIQVVALVLWKFDGCESGDEEEEGGSGRRKCKDRTLRRTHLQTWIVLNAFPSFIHPFIVQMCVSVRVLYPYFPLPLNSRKRNLNEFCMFCSRPTFSRNEREREREISILSALFLEVSVFKTIHFSRSSSFYRHIPRLVCKLSFSS